MSVVLILGSGPNVVACRDWARAPFDRVVAVKVDNAPEAGPPIGIQEAELIIEAPVEGGLTRLTGSAWIRRTAPHVAS